MRLLQLDPCHSLPVQDTEKIESQASLLDQDVEQISRIEYLQEMREE